MQSQRVNSDFSLPELIGASSYALQLGFGENNFHVGEQDAD